MVQGPYFRKKRLWSQRLFVIGMLLISPLTAYAADDADRQGILYLPPGDLYPHYTADPHRVGFGVQWQNYSRTQIPDSGDHRVGLRAGGRFGIIRYDPYDSENVAWQINIEAGVNAQFDADYSLDNIGWDGRYGLLVTTRRSGSLAFKFGVLHDSSHVGDEYLERTGRGRIGYTRHEAVAGMSWAPDEHWMIYAEAGWGYQLGNKELMEPGRGQAGLEYGSCTGPREQCRGWYGALDISSMEERDWRFDTALQAGLMAHVRERTWRIGIEWYQGRPAIGEFFQYTERSLSLGIWIDV